MNCPLCGELFPLVFKANGDATCEWCLSTIRPCKYGKPHDWHFWEEVPQSWDEAICPGKPDLPRAIVVLVGRW
jgi:hypothetical protein